MKPQGFVPPSASPSAHEGSDLHVQKVVWLAAILVVVLVLSILMVLLDFKHLHRTFPDRTSEAAPVVTTAGLPPAPRLQTNPLRDLAAVRAVEDSHLHQYGWIDSTHTVAQIPIERAMVLWVKSYPAVESANATIVSPASASTNNAPASGVTELQMRQQKAQEANHAP